MNNADLFKGVIHDWQIYVRYSNVTAMRYPYIIMNSANDISFIETFWSYKYTIIPTHRNIDKKVDVPRAELYVEIMQPTSCVGIMLCE